MTIGASGRIVIEVDPEHKQALYEALAHENQTLKDWFLERSRQYIAQKSTIPLFPQEEKPKSVKG